MMWFVWLLWRQWIALQKARSLKEGLDEEHNISQGLSKEMGVLQQDDLLRQGSMTQLVAPLAIYVRDSNREG
jgi:hypothetical protein